MRPPRPGLTMVELVVAIAILVLILAAVVWFIDPLKRLAQAKNAARRHDVRALSTAIGSAMDEASDDGTLRKINRRWRMIGTETVERDNADFTRDAAKGDANRDRYIGAADYAIWAANFGKLNSAYTKGNFDQTADIGTGDYTLWAAGFGKYNEPVRAPCAQECGDLGGSMSSLEIPDPRGRAVMTIRHHLPKTDQWYARELNFLDDTTIAFWFKLAATPTVPVPLLTKSGTGGGISLALSPDGDALDLDFHLSDVEAGGLVRDRSVHVPAFVGSADRSWHHVVVAYRVRRDTVEFSVYRDAVGVNGFAQSLGGPPSLSADNPIVIGSGAVFTPQGFSLAADSFRGLIDDVRIYRGMIPASGVDQIRRGGEPPLSLASIGYWMFDEGRGDASEDSSDYNDNDATLFGSARFSMEVPSDSQGNVIIHYALPAFCLDLTHELVQSGGLPSIPVNRTSGDITPTSDVTYYAVRSRSGIIETKSCLADPEGPGGTGAPPRIDAAQ